ncbi:MAG: hypothetical protein DA405_05285 [Bacteroidetes bacterium]|nr:MAG: hypothetical protein DA405_05285 [Bacteroidota bacterium]
MHKLMFKVYRYFFGISLLLGLSLNLGTPLCAQTSYFNIIHPPGDNNADVIETDSSYVLMQQGNPFWNDLHLHHFDKTGIHLKTDSIRFNAFYESSLGGLANFKKGYLKLGTLFSGSDTGRAHLTYFNEKLDTVRTWNYSYLNQQSTEAISVHFYEPNTILVTGMYFIRAGNRRHGLAIALDTSFNVIWEKTYFPTNLNNLGGYSFTDAISTIDGGYVFGGERVYFTNDSSQLDKGLILKVDSLGNEEWRREISGPKGSNKVLVQELNDTCFAFITSQKIRYLQDHFFTTRLRYGKMSLSNQVYVDTVFTYTGVDIHTYFFHKDNNGNLITGGYIHNPNWGSYAMQLSSNGDSLWFKDYFNGPDRVLEIGVLESMTFTQDGGMLFAGYFLDRNGNGANMWLVKTDSLGCDTLGCHNIGLEELPRPMFANIHLYPNPAKDQVQLSLNNVLIKDYQKLTVTVLNPLGQLLSSQSLLLNKSGIKLDISGLPTGTYLVEVWADESSLGVARLVVQ